MWKKGETGEGAAPEARPSPAPAAAPPAERRSRPAGERATIGPSIRINGDVTGEEDLLVQGRVEGSIHLAQHAVTIGPEGRVRADVSGQSVTVEGEVIGDLRAADQVVLRRSAKVEGDIVAPRVTIEDGASFRGAVDMAGDASAKGGRSPASPLRTAEAPSPPAPQVKDAAGG
jgi:cytoskeletal protein CcmA (bactofilin family)